MRQGFKYGKLIRRIIFVTIFLFLFLYLSRFFIFKRYSSLDESFSVVLPRIFYTKVGNGQLYSSPNQVDPQATNFVDGVVRIQVSPLSEWFKNEQYAKKNYSSITEFVDTMEQDEWEKSTHQPVIPGTGQFRVIGKSKLNLPSGFEEVEGLETTSPSSEAHMYWYIKNGKLYNLYIQYPKNTGRYYMFKIYLPIIVKSLLIP